MSGPFGTQSNIDAKPDFSFPKDLRLLRSGDFREVYREGFRTGCRYFRAFCRPRDEGSEPRVGFTTPRALGKAVIRNRIKRKMREAVRHEVRELGPGWDVVFNPRRTVVSAPPEELRREVQKVFRRCNGS